MTSYLYVCLVSHTYNGTEHRTGVRIKLAPVHVYFVSKGTYYRRTLFENDSFFINRILQFDSIWWKHVRMYEFASYRETTYYVLSMFFVFPNGITQHITQQPADNHDCR